MISRLICNNMKNLSLILSLVLLLVLSGNSYAEGLFQTARMGSQAATREALKTQSNTERTLGLKERADNEITRRVTSLSELISKINKLKKLSVADKSNFVAKLQAEIDSLNALKVKIDADTDQATLKADVQSIVQSYRVYAFFIPQIRILIAADSMSTTSDHLTTLYTKLQTLVASSGATGDVLTNMQSLLADMQGKITDAKSQYQLVENEVSALTLQGYPGNITTLKDARAKLEVGAKDLKTARDDARKIVKILRSLNKPLKASRSAELEK